MQTARSQRRDSSASNLRENTRSSIPSRMYQINGIFFRLGVSEPTMWALTALVTKADGLISSSNLDNRLVNDGRYPAERTIWARPGRWAVSPVLATASGQGRTH